MVKRPTSYDLEQVCLPGALAGGPLRRDSRSSRLSHACVPQFSRAAARGFNESCPVCKLERCSFCLRGVQPTPGTMPCCCDHVERPTSPSAQALYLVKYLCKTDTCIPEIAGLRAEFE